MAVTASFYGKFWLSLANKEIDFNSDTIKVLLTTNSYTPDKDTHQYKSSITNEVVGTGYTATGATIGSPTITYDAANDRLVFDGADVAWSGATITGARRAVVYDSTPASDATRPLIMWVDFGQDLSPVNGTISLTWDSIGMGYVTT
jgi:hypothetical protein